MRINIDSDFDDQVTITRHTLKAFDVAVERRLSKNKMAAENASIESFMDEQADCLVLKMRTWILSSPHRQDSVEVQVWKSWWDHFKNDHFPRWALLAFPAKRKVRQIVSPYNIYVCPHADVKFSDRAHLEFMLQDPFKP